MTIVGFMFNSIEVRRPDIFNPRVKILNNINIKNIEGAKFNLGNTQEQGLKLSFEYTSLYGDAAKAAEQAKIRLEGHVLFIANNESTKETLKSWDKERKLPNTVLAGILDYVLQKCTVQSVMLSKEMSLPPPVRFPKVSPSIGNAPKPAAAEKKAEAPKKAKK